MKSERNRLTNLLLVVLFVSTLVFSISFSAHRALSNQEKIESLANNSGLYGYLVSQITSEGQKTLQVHGLNQILASQLKSDAEASYTQAEFSDQASAVISSSYPWLEGKAKTPNFNLDLSDVKQNLFNDIAQSFITYADTLPACDYGQDLAIEQSGTFNFVCKPLGFNSTYVTSRVLADLSSSNSFLNNPVITAQNLTVNNKPYYSRYSKLPVYYQLLSKLPVYSFVVAIICLLLISLISVNRRRSAKHVGYLLIIAGVLTLISIPLKGTINSHVLSSLDNSFSLGSLVEPINYIAKNLVSSSLKLIPDLSVIYIFLGLLSVYLAMGTLPEQAMEPVKPEVKKRRIAKVEEPEVEEEVIEPEEPVVAPRPPIPVPKAAVGPKPVVIVRPPEPLEEPKPASKKKRKKRNQKPPSSGSNPPLRPAPRRGMIQ